MFETLLEEFGTAGNSFEGFLGELWPIWNRDASRAVLLARWSWQRLPEELIQQAAAIQQQTQYSQSFSNIESQVNTQLGSMGIFSGSPTASAMPLGPGIDPSAAMFITVMSMVRACRGDPPLSPASGDITPIAEAVLQGKVDAVEAMIGAAPPQVRQQIIAAANLLKMTGMDNFLRLEAEVLFAFALPRERIPIALVNHLVSGAAAASASSSHIAVPPPKGGPGRTLAKILLLALLITGAFWAYTKYNDGSTASPPDAGQQLGSGAGELDLPHYQPSGDGASEQNDAAPSSDDELDLPHYQPSGDGASEQNDAAPSADDELDLPHQQPSGDGASEQNDTAPSRNDELDLPHEQSSSRNESSRYDRHLIEIPRNSGIKLLRGRTDEELRPLAFLSLEAFHG